MVGDNDAMIEEGSGGRWAYDSVSSTSPPILIADVSS